MGRQGSTVADLKSSLTSFSMAVCLCLVCVCVVNAGMRRALRPWAGEVAVLTVVVVVGAAAVMPGLSRRRRRRLRGGVVAVGWHDGARAHDDAVLLARVEPSEGVCAVAELLRSPSDAWVPFHKAPAHTSPLVRELEAPSEAEICACRCALAAESRFDHTLSLVGHHRPQEAP